MATIFFGSKSTDTVAGEIADFDAASGDKISLERVSVSGVGADGKPARLVWSGTEPAAYGVWIEPQRHRTYVHIDSTGDGTPNITLDVLGAVALEPAHFLGLGDKDPDTGGDEPKIAITPRAEGLLEGAPPKAFTYTVRVDHADRVKWAVFQVSTGGRWTSESDFTTVDVPGGTADIQVTANLLGDRDRLVVKTLDDKVEDVTEGVRFKVEPVVGGDAYERVRKFIAPLRYGINVERGQMLWKGWITDDVLRHYAAAGVTHVRYFPPSGGRYALISQNDLKLWIDACRRTIACGMKAHLDLLDVMGLGHLNEGIAAYIAACGRTIAEAGLDPNKFMVGAVNEYEGGTNKQFEGWRERLTDLLHVALPNFCVVSNSGYWGSPDRLIDGTMKVDPSKPRLHQWHLYELAAGDPANQVWWQDRISKWAAANKTISICGEWGVGPPDNSNGAAGNYGQFPKHIVNAAKGMGQQRPTHWTVTDGGWWRLNENNSARLRPEIAAAIKEGSDHIAQQQWYKDQQS